MSFFYWQTVEGSFLFHMNIVNWTSEQKKDLDIWLKNNTYNGISYGNGLLEFENIDDMTAFILTWT